MIASGSHLKYARALYKVAAKNNAEERVFADLEGLENLLKDKHFNDLVKKITHLESAKLSQLLGNIFKDKVHTITLNALILLGISKKIGLLPRMAEAYRQVYHSEKNIYEIKVCSARKLQKDQESELKEKLQKKFDKPLSVRFEENPDLIGGIQIYEHGYMTDYSVQNYLNTLKQNLMKETINL